MTSENKFNFEQSVTDIGFSQRLGVISQVLHVPMESSISLENWQKVTEQQDLSREYHIVLAHLLAFARYPHPEETEDLLRLWQQRPFIEILQQLFFSNEYSHLKKSGIQFHLVIPNADKLYVDISHTISCRYLSGIQRVVRFLSQPWIDNRAPVSFFIFRNDAPRPSLVTVEEEEYFSQWTKSYGAQTGSLVKNVAANGSQKIVNLKVAAWRLRPAWHLANRVGRRVKREFVKQKYLRPANDSPVPKKNQVLEVPVFLAHRILMPELCTENHRLDFYLSLKQSLPKSHLSMVLYDFIPIWHPEYVEISLIAYVSYLKLLRIVDSISCISGEIERQARHIVTCIREPLDVTIATHDLPGVIDITHVPNNRDETVLSTALPYVLCVGTIEVRKNQRTLLHACQKLMREGVKFRLIFAGNPGWKAEQFVADAKKAQNEGLEVEIKYAVAEEELIKLYEGCLFTVFCSHAEGFGLPIVESLRAGKPVVLSDRGCMRDLGNRLGGCLFVNPNKQESIENAVRTLLSDKEALDKLRSSISFEDWPDWNQYAASILSFCFIKPDADNNFPEKIAPSSQTQRATFTRGTFKEHQYTV